MTRSLKIPSYTLVEDQSLLQLLVEQWSSEEAIAVDTEFMRTNTFYPKAGLIQIASADGCFLIDPLAIKDTTPLKTLFADQSVVKVLHSCSEDLEMFDAYLGTLPEPLFDTQLACAFLNKGLSVSYKNTVLDMFGVDLPKGEQRSDWLQRPLSKTQLDYAALDVEFLLEIYGRLSVQLQEADKLAWLNEECQRLLDKQRRVVVPEEAYLKVKAAWRMDGPQLRRLQRVAAWREREAREADTPRGFLLKDPVMLELVQKAPTDVAELRTVEGIHPRIMRIYADKLLQLCRELDEDPSNNVDLTPVQGPLPRHMGVYVKQLKKWIEACAERNGISAELLFNRKTLNQMVLDLDSKQEIEFSPSVGQWRRECCGPAMIEFLTELKESMAT